MSAVELLQKAVRLDTNGRMLEALKLYQSGIDELLKVCKVEEDAAKKLHYKEKIKEYMTRAEQIKELYKSQIYKGQIVDKRHIIENSTGNSYEAIFGKYLKDDVTEILLDEPYIREHYQLVNLVKFCELVVLKCRNLRYIHVTTTKDPRGNADQSKAFSSLGKSLKNKAISLNIEFSEHIHDRQIITESTLFPYELSTTPKSFVPYVCNLSPKFEEMAADELREDDNIRIQALAQFREWIAKHPHIKKCRTDAPFLLRFLRTKKFSISAASDMLENFLTARQLYPQWFQNLDIEDETINEIISGGHLLPLPERDANGRCVVFISAAKFDHKKYTSDKMARVFSLVLASLVEDEETQVAGCVFVADFSEVNVRLLSIFPLSDLRILQKIAQNAAPMRFKGAYFVNFPSFGNSVFNFVLNLLPEKFRRRIKILKNRDELSANISLPKEYGGTMPTSEMIAILKERLRKQRAAILALDEMYIEITKDSAFYVDNVDEMYSGMIGSFRKLQVD